MSVVLEKTGIIGGEKLGGGPSIVGFCERWGVWGILATFSGVILRNHSGREEPCWMKMPSPTWVLFILIGLKAVNAFGHTHKLL